MSEEEHPEEKKKTITVKTNSIVLFEANWKMPPHPVIKSSSPFNWFLLERYTLALKQLASGSLSQLRHTKLTLVT